MPVSTDMMAKEMPLREGGEMGAGEGAETEMDDAGVQRRVIDVWPPHRPRQTGQFALGQTHIVTPAAC
jgi:hypothetical protein